MFSFLHIESSAPLKNPHRLLALVQIRRHAITQKQSCKGKSLLCLSTLPNITQACVLTNVILNQ